MFNVRNFWYNVKKMLRQSFTDFIFATNTDGSGKAASYVRALDMLGPILTKHYPNPIIGGKCCVTGLSVPDVLRASHISPWAEDEKNRFNPENGLCLSATYDAAFDRHLISFDEHYRLIVSKEIKNHYTDAVAKSYFLDREGQKMMFPTKYHPSQVFLTKHRDLLAE